MEQKSEPTYTYSDYETWNDETRRELIGGIPYAMSPATSKRDRDIKFNLYRNAGVQEYWIVDPDSRNLFVYLLRDGEYISRVYGDAERVAVNIFDGCTIPLEEVFPPLEPAAPRTEPAAPPSNAE